MSEANLQGADQTFQLFWDGCAHLQVWDGSRCSHTLLKVNISPDEHHVTEGPTSFSARKEQLIANVLVYDNHVELARHLKVRHTHTHTLSLMSFCSLLYFLSLTQRPATFSMSREGLFLSYFFSNLSKSV